MKTQAAVLVELGCPLVLADLQIPALKPGQALIEVAVSGVCHTQILEASGYRGQDRFLPHCLGHEGSGTVREVGPGVTKVRPGDAVVLSWIKGSGADVASTVYGWGEKSVNAGAITTFSRHAVISENRLTLLPAGVPLREAAMLGCAVPTGIGAVWNVAQARPGESLAVFGVGGVGLCAVLGAGLAGCLPIIAIDVSEAKLDVARRLGATHVVQAGVGDVVEAIRATCPDGVDIAIEASGRPDVMRQALRSVRVQGGRAIVVGNARHGEELTIDPRELNQGKRLLGTWGGDSQPDRDTLRYGRLLAGGKLHLAPLTEKSYRLDEVNTALQDLESGRALRPLIDMAERV